MKWRSLEESRASSDLRPLREIFAERKELISKYVPAETQAIHAQAVAELKACQLSARILPVGAKAPDFELPDHNGTPVNSSALRSKGRLVLCFIRGRWCPFCVGQFGLTYRVPAPQEAVYRRAFVNLPFTNGDDSWELPIPATYILDDDGTILYASANEDYTERPEPAAILDFLKSRA
jgi:peroxiredoxin